MIDYKTRISAATAQSHKQVIWDLQALNCFHMAEEECLGSLAHTHRAVTLPDPHSHTHVPTDLVHKNMHGCLFVPAFSPPVYILYILTLVCALLPPLFLSPLLACTLRQRTFC